MKAHLSELSGKTRQCPTACFLIWLFNFLGLGYSLSILFYTEILNYGYIKNSSVSFRSREELYNLKYKSCDTGGMIAFPPFPYLRVRS